MQEGNVRNGKSSRLRPYLVACIVSQMQLMFGVCIGWMSPAAIVLEANPPPIGGDHPFTKQQINWLGSLTFIGCLIGNLIWGALAEKIGRKRTCCALALPVILGWSLISLAKSHTLMYLGRFTLGLSGVGAIAPLQLYVNEISEDSYKGTLTSMFVLFFNGGIALSYLLGSLLSLRDFTLVCNVFPLLYLLVLYSVPESPVYLYRKSKNKEAEISFLWFRNNDYVKVQEELSKLKETTSYASKNKQKSSFSSLCNGIARSKALIINIWLMLAQQFCGIIVMITYSSSILRDSGTDLIDPDNGAVIVGVIQLILSCITTMILEKTPRKLLLMWSLVGMFISQILMGWYNLGDYSQIFPNWLPLVLICLHVASYCVGIGPVGFVILAEITHPKIQPTAFSLFGFTSTVATFLSLKIYPYLITYVGESGCFWFYASWCPLTMLLISGLLPETKGKSFEQITKLLEGKSEKNDEWN